MLDKCFFSIARKKYIFFEKNQEKVLTTETSWILLETENELMIDNESALAHGLRCIAERCKKNYERQKK